MNAVTFLVILAVMAGAIYGFYRLLCWISDVDNWFPKPEPVPDPGFQKAEPPRYEITRIVHKTPHSTGVMDRPVYYSGFSGTMTESYSSAVDRTAFDEAFDRTKEHLQRLSDHERRIRERGEGNRRRSDGEEDRPAEGSPEEGRTYRPGEVRGPDPINEIRFGGI